MSALSSSSRDCEVTGVIEPPSADPISLRLASPDDASALARAAATFFEQTFAAANRPENMKDYLAHAFSEERQRAELRDPNQRVWVTVDARGEIVGYAHVRLGATSRHVVARHPVEIARVYADQRLHGKGLGAALMRACIDFALDCGADVVWLGVWERNPRAIAFYAKHGFRTVGDQEFLLGTDRQRDLVLARYLTTES